ncbi:LysR family transcriptional regulator [Mesorhizobium sp. 1M-11]|uniref:LysR family transcriptional regulator n=1 Tax=Mesorhizobium sp. 1M-11 TaxID=1529006 RepID=UPI0006C73819|nr:LysR family transcriptional regulator [Mesorhizobium sp. 1M-11]
MRLEWLEDILAVAETGSFSEAADRRHLTQSAFSRRIQNIEDQVGTELFDRTRKPIHLLRHTEAQRDQIAHLARLLRQLNADLRRGDRMSENKLVISSQHSLTTSLTPAIIKDISLHRSDIYIRLRSANLADCFAQLLSRQADILIVYRLPGHEHPILGSYIDSITIGVERLIPVLAPKGLPRLSASREAGEVPYIAYPVDVFLGQVLEREILPRIRDSGDASPKAETALTLASIEMAGLGIGVAWVPESLARDRIDGGKLADLSGSLPSCSLEVTAVRLVGKPGPVEVAVWERLLKFQSAVAASEE